MPSKNLIITILFINVFCLAYAQESSIDKLNNSLMSGSAEFFNKIGQVINYPKEARMEGIEGISECSFQVNCENKIVAINFNNELGHGIENEIASTLNNLNFDWKPCNERNVKEVYRLKFGFAFTSPSADNKADFWIKAMSSASVNYNVEFEKQRLTDKFNRLIKKGKKEKAQLCLDKLIEIDPQNADYKEMKRKLTQE